MQPFILVTIRHDRINLHTEVAYMIGFDIIPNISIKKKKTAAISIPWNHIAGGEIWYGHGQSNQSYGFSEEVNRGSRLGPLFMLSTLSTSLTSLLQRSSNMHAFVCKNLSLCYLLSLTCMASFSILKIWNPFCPFCLTSSFDCSVNANLSLKATTYK